MPCLRGIEVSLTTKPGNEQIPEYPHPEGTSARILSGANLAKAPSPRASNTPNCSKGQAVFRKAGPTVSVYIPSIPGTPFAINYSINNAPPGPCKYVFFRLYMNARPIAAWGIDPEVRPMGKVVRSLWAPCAQYKHQIGFEGRNFVFLPGQEYKSVAEDGGLIEIQVFRAKERRARAPRLEEFRFQENYGIAAPSIGLLDQPQDACFYDWHLLDAKDSPFASFRLHYRSWTNLNQLNLIPATELERLHSVSPKALKSLTRPEPDFKAFNDALDEQSFLSEDSDGAVFQSHLEEHDVDDRDTSHYFLKSPPELFPVSSLGPRVPQPSKALRDAYREPYLQRPLPELPVEAPRSLSRRSSVASAISATVSITPSLLDYVEEASLSPEDIEVGIAQLIQLPASESSLSQRSDEGQKSMPSADYSFSDYDNSPQSTNNSFSEDKKLSPRRYLPTTGSVLEKGLRLFTSPKQPAVPRASDSSRSLPSAFIYSEQDLALLESITLSEPEWLNRSPSPPRTSVDDDATFRESGSRSGKNGSGSLFPSLRRKMSGSPRKLAAKVLRRDVSK